MQNLRNCGRVIFEVAIGSLTDTDADGFLKPCGVRLVDELLGCCDGAVLEEC